MAPCTSAMGRESQLEVDGLRYPCAAHGPTKRETRVSPGAETDPYAQARDWGKGRRRWPSIASVDRLLTSPAIVVGASQGAGHGQPERAQGTRGRAQRG